MKFFASFVILVCVGFFGGEVWADDATWVDAAVAANQAQNGGSPTPSATNAEVNAIADRNDAASAAETSSSQSPSSSPSPSTPPGQSPLSKPSFMFDASNISPATKKYTAGNNESGGAQWNVKTLLERIANLLLIVVSTGAVLSIIIGGFLMATSAWDTEKANRGKIIITYNIIAVCIAMLSYGIIQFVIWVVGVPS